MAEERRRRANWSGARRLFDARPARDIMATCTLSAKRIPDTSSDRAKACTVTAVKTKKKRKFDNVGMAIGGLQRRIDEEKEAQDLLYDYRRSRNDAIQRKRKH